MCDCRSHNAEVGTVPEVVLSIPERFKQERDTVCVDSCIVDAVKALWDMGIWTLGSCCGHGGRFPPREIIVDRSDAPAAARLMKAMNDPAKILCWELVESVTIAPTATCPKCGGHGSLLGGDMAVSDCRQCNGTGRVQSGAIPLPPSGETVTRLRELSETWRMLANHPMREPTSPLLRGVKVARLDCADELDALLRQMPVPLETAPEDVPGSPVWPTDAAGNPAHLGSAIEPTPQRES